MSDDVTTPAPEPAMDAVCGRCGARYGAHQGPLCPDHQGHFLLATDVRHAALVAALAALVTALRQPVSQWDHAHQGCRGVVAGQIELVLRAHREGQ
jgi:hypothetical protein